jgi:hypothetical protein
MVGNDVKRACNDFLAYQQTILCPASQELDRMMDAQNLKLHYVISVNMLTAHLLDYLLAIRKAAGKDISRRELVKEFDRQYAVEGARIQNRKFELVDGVNNAIKHIWLEDKRYRDLFEQYGVIGFRCLREDNGFVMFEVGKYRFDYARIVLRHVLATIVPVWFDELEEVEDFALSTSREGIGTGVDDIEHDPHGPIDQMIAYCNPTCLDCGEEEETCRCSKFLYGKNFGEFNPDWDEEFDFDSVMSKISGAYRKG